MSAVRSSVILAVAVVCFAATASAQTVGILELQASGVPEAALERFELALVDGLEGANFEVKDRDKLVNTLKRGSFVEGCNFGPCLRQVHADTGVELVLVARVQGLGSSYSFIASLVDTRTGLLATQVSRSCAACSVDDAALTASMLGSDLLLERTNKKDGAKAPRSGVAKSSGPRRSAAESRRSSLRVASYLFLGASLAAGAAGGYLWYDGNEDKGVPLVAGAGAGFVGGLSMFLFSREF